MLYLSQSNIHLSKQNELLLLELYSNNLQVNMNDIKCIYTLKWLLTALILIQQRIKISKFMYNHRPNIDLQSVMLDKGSALSKPRAPTPIRKGPAQMLGNIGNKQNQINPTNQRMGGPTKDIGRVDNQNAVMHQNLIKKPLISPVRNPFKAQIQCLYAEQKKNNKGGWQQKQPAGQLNCTNHPGKTAQFNIDIDEQCFAYCNKCAAQLASQGFEVRKIEQLTVKKGDNKLVAQVDSHLNRQLPMYPQYEGNPMYELILEFLTELSQVQNEHLQNMTKLTMIQNNYFQQIELTKSFYSELMAFLEQMRDDHINDLAEESRKHSQIADIQHDYLRENVQQIGNIRRDIEENLQTIVQKLQEQDLRNNLGYYKQKLQVYKHKVEEQTEFFGKVISFKNEEYQSKLTRVQDFLMQVWNTDDQQSQSVAQNQNIQNRFVDTNMQSTRPEIRTNNNINKINNFPPVQQNMPRMNMNVQNMVPKNQMGGMQQNIQRKVLNQVPSQPQNKTTAFRKLFDQDEDQVMAETSPQFKKI